MCLICVEYEKGKLKIKEALTNLEEMKESVGLTHYDEVKAFLAEESLNEYYNVPYLGREIDEYNFDDEYWEKWGFGD
tara:strand:- start:66 stop:296 length:231 start_codon:yes stop_codon:yes gene_type:complete